MKVFVVDDAPIMLEIIENILKNYVDEGLYCEDVNSLLYHKLDEFQPDVIILDLNLKDTDGVKVSEMLKQHEVHKNIPIIAISSDTYVQRRLMEESNNFVDFISKPIQADELISKITKYGSIGKLFNLSEPLLKEIRQYDKVTDALKKL